MIFSLFSFLLVVMTEWQLLSSLHVEPEISRTAKDTFQVLPSRSLREAYIRSQIITKPRLGSQVVMAIGKKNKVAGRGPSGLGVRDGGGWLFG